MWQAWLQHIRALSPDPNWLARQIAEAKKPLVEALQGILDIGKRDMSNPKYDGYFETARAALESTRRESR